MLSVVGGLEEVDVAGEELHRDSRVEGRHQAQRQDEEEREDEEVEELPRLLRPPPLHAHARLEDPLQPVGRHVVDDEQGAHGGGREQPDEDQHDPNLAPRENHLGTQWPQDGKVAVEGDGHHREDADPDGHALQEGRQLAHGLPVDPVAVDVVAEGDGQTHADHHQVADGEVEEEDIGEGPHVAMPQYDKDDEDIADQPHGKVEGVDDDEGDGEGLLVAVDQQGFGVKVVVTFGHVIVVRGEVEKDSYDPAGVDDFHCDVTYTSAYIYICIIPLRFHINYVIPKFNILYIFKQ